MGCAAGYCSRSSDIIISKDKRYTVSIISDLMTHQLYSNKTNNKFLSVSSLLQDNEDKINSSMVSLNHRHALSNKELKIPDNPLPFVKIKPKKSIY